MLFAQQILKHYSPPDRHNKYGRTAPHALMKRNSQQGVNTAMVEQNEVPFYNMSMKDLSLNH